MWGKTEKILLKEYNIYHCSTVNSDKIIILFVYICDKTGERRS